MKMVVKIDKKGRITLPKKIRGKVGIDDEALIEVKRDSIEIKPVDSALKKAMEIAEHKLKGWKEEEHEAEKLLERLK